MSVFKAGPVWGTSGSRMMNNNQPLVGESDMPEAAGMEFSSTWV